MTCSRRRIMEGDWFVVSSPLRHRGYGSVQQQRYLVFCLGVFVDTKNERKEKIWMWFWEENWKIEELEGGEVISTRCCRKMKKELGAITPEFMLISTPAVRDHARFSRKRKTILDGMVVLPNERLKKSIQDASALISNRGKSHPTLLAAQRQSRISSLPNGFYESLIPCYSVELKFLFSEKVKIPNSLEIVQTPGKLDVPESQTVGSPEHIEATPQTPPQYPTIKDRSIEHPERTEIQNLGSLGPLSPHESIETEQSLERDEELSLMEELNSYESLEREQCMTKDDDLVLMNEDINSYEAENSESCENSLAGWSEQTRKVASDLHKRFQSQRQEEVVNFSQVLVGRDRKECAKLFYEILVLRTTSVVDVNQNTAHGDIRIRKLPKLDQTFATDGL